MLADELKVLDDLFVSSNSCRILQAGCTTYMTLCSLFLQQKVAEDALGFEFWKVRRCGE